MMKRLRRRFSSFYMKLVLMFLVIGLLPLVLMGMLIYNVYSSTLNSNMLSSFQKTADLMSGNLADYAEELSDMTEYIYRDNITDYGAFYELIEDERLSETGKNAMVTRVLRSILQMSEYIDHVMFVTPDGEQYACMRPPELLPDSGLMEEWYDTYFLPGTRAVSWIPTHETRYFVNSECLDFTVYRNIMNTSTLQKAGSEVLGTLFIDVGAEYLGKMMKQESYGDMHEIYLVDCVTGQYLYHPRGDYESSDARESGILTEEMQDEQNGCIQKGKEYLVFSRVDGTDWMIVDRVLSGAVDGGYKMIRNSTFFLMVASILLLMAVYVGYSRKLNRPVTELKQAMGQIEKGDLSVRVQIHSNDELEDIGNGLNQMVENLSAYIQKAYVAEIRQRDAELEALKTQIQPHYLYNTLDVIRMSAITNDDTVVAGMINSLSAQLKYLIGTTGKMVMLRDEITCIENYFKLIEVRFDYQFSLEISVPSKLMRCYVPHLIIQPVVENAVKHGLRPKRGPGEVVVQAKENLDCLELTVMDNGVGMTEQRLDEVKRLLRSNEPGMKDDIKGMSIGVKNVSDRIRHLYGEGYGLEIDAYEGMGTIVKYWLPLTWEPDLEET